MALRVSSEWSSDLKDVKENATHVKIKKPLRPELYQDAARILEELFANQLEDQGLKQREVNTLGRKTSDTQRSADAGSILSADSSSVTNKHRKKTLFRKAKVILLHAFHRQARERDADLRDDKSHAKERFLKKAFPKHKGKEKKGVVESVVRRLSRKKDNSYGSQSVRSEEKNGSQLPQKEIDRHKNIGLMKSLQRSNKRVSNKEKVCPPGDTNNWAVGGASGEVLFHNKTHEEKEKLYSKIAQKLITIADAYSFETGLLDSEAHQKSGHQEEGSSVDDLSKTATSQGSLDSLPLYSPQSVAQSNSTAAHRQTAYGLAPYRHDQELAVPLRPNSPSPFPQSTSTESYHDSGNKSSSMHSLASAHGKSSSSSKNVLDYPGEDIQFMDDDGRIRSRHASGNDKRSSTIFFQIPPPIVTVDSGYSNNGTTSPIHPPPPPPPPPTGKSAKLQRCVSLQVDGDTNNWAGGGASGEVLFHNKTHEKKEKLNSKVAPEILTIEDAFSVETGLSDSEAHHKSGHQEAVDLEKLVKQIIECLRGKGDELSHKIDGPAEKLVEQTKAQTYERFERTIQHSLGNEVNLKYLALLFYSTKAVVKAVGHSSDAAAEVTEMTLRYFSDKFSSWIIDQGGFETLVESDSELD